MSSSEMKTVFERWEDGHTFELPGFPSGTPKTIVVTEHAKEVFRLARGGQGLIGVSWIGKNDEGLEVMYLDLMPAFNKNDGMERTNKEGEKYVIGKTCVYTDEPLGGNSGRNHLQFLTILQDQLQTDDEKILKMYEGSYLIDQGKKVFQKTKMFGFGLFKGD